MLKSTVRVLSLALVLSLLALPERPVAADGAFVKEVVDDRGRVLSVEPRQHTTIRMRNEAVALVPFYDAAISREHPLVYVNVRYVFENPDAATTLHVGFPDMRGKVLTEDYNYAKPEAPKCGEHGEGAELTCPGTIETFAADSDGHGLPVTVGPGTGDYLRWFVFDVAFPAHGTVSLRNRYVARIGYTRRATNTDAELRYELEYVLHTGSTWTGPIGEGDIAAWDGGWKPLRHFTALRPTRSDDVHTTLDATETTSAGRPLFYWYYINGEQRESVPPHFEKSSVVRASSQQAGEAPSDLPHLAAMALDRDPTTAWLDGGAKGAVGEWLEVPVHRSGRVRALSLTQGEPGGGIGGIQRLRLGCLSLNGNARQSIEVDHLSVDVGDRPSEQRLVLPRPLAECHSLRITVEGLYGPPDRHASIAELAVVSPG